MYMLEWGGMNLLQLWQHDVLALEIEDSDILTKIGRFLLERLPYSKLSLWNTSFLMTLIILGYQKYQNK